MLLPLLLLLLLLLDELPDELDLLEPEELECDPELDLLPELLVEELNDRGKN